MLKNKKSIFILISIITLIIALSFLLFENGRKVEVGETAVCNLSSVNLKEHLNDKGKINFKLLAKTIATQMRMLDNVIDLNFYPTDEAHKANMLHRPVGAGSMGWADVFNSYKVNFSSEDACKFSDELYEFISTNTRR